MIALTSRRVLTPEGVAHATVHMEGTTLARVTPGGHPGALDLGDWVLMPSLVDTHVHVNEPGRTAWEGFETATKAAALGGVTAIGDMPLNSLPVTTTRDALEAKIAATSGKLHVDCALWGGVVPGNTPELAPMVDRGIRGFKCFLCPSGIDEFPEVGERDLLEAMPALRALGVPLLAHAELELPLREAAGGDARDYQTYLHSRPPEWEDAAVALLIDLCRTTGCPIHIVHLSSAGALPLLRRAKQEGLPVTAETCPHYLCLRAEDVPAGATEFKCAPPIREGANRDALWAALADGTLDFVVTDHSPCVPGLKLPEEGDFMQAWGGIASLQLGLASVWTEARARGFHLVDLMRWMSAGPRSLLGLPGGALVAGAPADLVAWDPEGQFTVEGSALAHRHPTTPYAGQRLQGRVHHVWLRGQPIVTDGVLSGPVRGRLITGGAS
jgi:allantoinase